MDNQVRDGTGEAGMHLIRSPYLSQTQTDNGNGNAKACGMTEAPTKLEDTIAGVLKVLDAAKRETHGGIFLNYRGEVLPW